MKYHKTFLALIPARGGSKRLPHKNLRPLAGRPLIEWSIAAALGSRHLDAVVVSTDDSEIARVSATAGAEVPFLRPAALAADDATTSDVVVHALGRLRESEERVYDYVVVLQPTSPLRSAEDIDRAIGLTLEKRADAVISVCECEHPPLWANTLPDDLSMDGFLSRELRNTRSQDLPTYYRLNGAIYTYRCDRVLEQGSILFERNMYAYIMPRDRSVDIDTVEDFEYAEFLLGRGG